MERRAEQAVGAGALSASAATIETDALVIGAGPVGLFQVFQLGLLEISCQVVDALPHAGGQCAQLYGDKPIYDIPGLPATTGQGLTDALLNQVAPFHPALHLGQQVTTMAREDDGRMRFGTSAGTGFLTKVAIIAGGVGAFMPKRIALEGLARYEGTQVRYHPEQLDGLEDRHVVLVGGNDAVLDAATALATRSPGQEKPASITVLHRRDAFQAEDALVARMRKQCDAGALRLLIGQIAGCSGDDGALRGLEVLAPDGGATKLQADTVLAWLGISPRLGPIADWGLQLERKQVPVDTERFETRQPGVFAVGDINTYPGKKKLIVCGFHEATLAAWGARTIVHPDRPAQLQYTTTSTRLHELLGVAPVAANRPSWR